MFVEDGHKRIFLKTLVKDFNAKKKQRQLQLHQLKENLAGT